MTTNNIRVGIAGAGIMGRILAWQLAQQGFTISLFDKDAISNGSACAYTAAGMLSPYSEIETADLTLFNLGIHSLTIWPKLMKQLNIASDYKQRGSLIISHTSDKSDLERFNQQLNYKFAHVLPNQPKLIDTQLDREQLNQLEPELADRFSQATYLSEEAWLNPACVMTQLAEQLLEAGINWHPNSYIEKISNNQLTVNQQDYQFDWVIDCRGIGAKKDINNLRAVRGELMVLQAPEVKINRLIRLMHPRYRLYLVPWGKNDLYTIGATQIESEDYGPISVRSCLELLSAAYSLHPGFSEAKLIESKTNCRPALANNLPRIIINHKLIQVNGLFRHGFLLAPTLAQEIAFFLQLGHNFSARFPSIFEQKVS